MCSITKSIPVSLFFRLEWKLNSRHTAGRPPSGEAEHPLFLPCPAEHCKNIEAKCYRIVDFFDSFLTDMIDFMDWEERNN